MIIPSIDLQSGKAVQLIGGKEFAVDGGDPMAWAREFGIAGEIGVIDLDAALGTGNNRETIVGILKDHRCRVGGGIRTIEDALFYLDHGALQVIIGTKATPKIFDVEQQSALDRTYNEALDVFEPTVTTEQEPTDV
jgi:phosphoribosylformimino-5-aminoimidazole carboxamide ribonucleotide (ProFAR) isomerase